MSVRIHSLDDLHAHATKLVGELSPKAEGATLVTLSGELGAGKTAFTKACGAALGVEEDVTSPTFVLAKHYALSDQAFSTLVHIDAYRLNDGSELAPLRFGELLADPKNLILLEWPEQVADALPKADVALTLTLHDDGSRELSYA